MVVKRAATEKEREDERTPAAQPRPWADHVVSRDSPTRCDRFDGSLLQMVADFACATVDDACALRAANKDFRRAVDATVRRWVFVNQPGLVVDAGVCGDDETNTCGRSALMLNGGVENTAIDAVCVAFTCDTFPAVTRLVVVSFALDGPKAEEDVAQCGERPVVDRRAGLLGESTVHGSTSRCIGDGGALPRPLHRALRRCLVTARPNVDNVPDVGAPEHELANPWPHLRELDVNGLCIPRQTAAKLRRVAAILQVVGPQLTSLALAEVSRQMCPLLRDCVNLTRFTSVRIETCRAPLVDALIASEAKLTEVDVPLQKPADAIRLLREIPTIIDARIGGCLKRAQLPADLSDRIRLLGIMGSSPPLDHVDCFPDRVDSWAPRPHATSLSVNGGSAPLPVTDFAVHFPKLQSLALNCGLELAEVAALRFPASLESFTAHRGLSHHMTGQLLRQWAGGCPPIPFQCLTAIVIADFALGSIDVASLVAFSGTLQQLTLRTVRRDVNPPWCPEREGFERDLACLEATLAQLTALTAVEVTELPTARCFLGGRHKSLRELLVGCIDAPGDARFAELVEACPRLLRARGTRAAGGADNEAGGGGGLFVVPDGWVLDLNPPPRSSAVVEVSRTPFKRELNAVWWLV